MGSYKTLMLLICSVTAPWQSLLAQDAPVAAITFKNDTTTIAVAPDGKILQYLDHQNGVQYCRQPSAFAHIKKDGVSHAASQAVFADGKLTLAFGSSGVTASLRVTAGKRHFVVEVVSVEPEQIDELAFVDLPLTLTGATNRAVRRLRLGAEFEDKRPRHSAGNFTPVGRLLPTVRVRWGKGRFDRMPVRRASQSDAGCRHCRR